MQPTIAGGASRTPPTGGSGVPANTNSNSVTATLLDVLEKQLLLLSERANDSRCDTEELCALTKAMCTVAVRILHVKAADTFSAAFAEKIFGKKNLMDI